MCEDDYFNKGLEFAHTVGGRSVIVYVCRVYWLLLYRCTKSFLALHQAPQILEFSFIF